MGECKPLPTTRSSWNMSRRENTAEELGADTAAAPAAACQGLTLVHVFGLAWERWIYWEVAVTKRLK